MNGYLHARNQHFGLIFDEYKLTDYSNMLN